MVLKKALHLQLTVRGKQFYLGIVTAIFILSIPFLFYSYRLVPHVEEAKIAGFNISAGQHVYLDYYAYYLFTKLVFLASFIFWFLTCKCWWRHAILVPIAMLIFQVLGVVNDSTQFIDEFDFWYSLPVVLPLLVLILKTSKWMQFYRAKIDLKEEIEKEIELIQKSK